MQTLGFGFQHVVWPVFRWPRASLVVFLAFVAAVIAGIPMVVFDQDIRGVFASSSDAYRDYVRVTDEFVDPENETLLLVEGASLGEPETFTRLRDLQFELQLVEDVGSVFSLFALREAPNDAGDAPVLVDDTSAGLTPALAERIRAHPLLGSKLLSADRETMLYVITPREAKAPLSTVMRMNEEVEAVAAQVLAGSDATVSISGFAAIRADIVDLLIHDQVLLNLAGAAIALVMSLIVFRSLAAAVMTAVPAVIGGASVLGGMGLLGIPSTVMSNLVPALVLILGYADAMHLSYAFRNNRSSGSDVLEAERRAQREVGPACVLTALTTSLAFLSLVISDVAIVRMFGLIGAVGTFVGMLATLVAHALLTLFIGRFWSVRPGRGEGLLFWLSRPTAAGCRFAVTYARPVAAVSAVLFVCLAVMHFSVPPQHSIREHLPEGNPANAALGRIDRQLDGAFPIQVIVPMKGVAAVSPEGLERIGGIHRAMAAINGVHAPVSLWSLVEWLGGDADEATAEKVGRILEQMGEATRSRFVSDSGSALVAVTIQEAPTQEVAQLLDAMEEAVRAAAGPDAVITGVAVLTNRESDRAITNLNVSLTLAVISGLAMMAVAFRNWRVGIIAILPNAMPVLATGALLYLSGRGMQFTSVLSLTIAFGIAVDDTIHYLNRFMMNGTSIDRLRERLIDTSRRIGPVLVGTTVVIVAGLATTQLSSLPTVNLFGELAAITLAAAILGNLIVLPALISGVARSWFDKRPRPQAAPDEAPVRA